MSRSNPSDSPDHIWRAQSRPPLARSQFFLCIFPALIQYRPMEGQESKSAPKDSLSANTRRRKARYEGSANLVARTDVRSYSENSTSSSFSSTPPPLPSPPHPVPSSSAPSPPSVSSRLAMSAEKRGLTYMSSLKHSYLLLLQITITH